MIRMGLKKEVVGLGRDFFKGLRKGFEPKPIFQPRPNPRKRSRKDGTAKV